MSAKRTSTRADSTTRRTARRPSTLHLLRVKVVTIVAAVVLFLASLTGIALYNPQAGNGLTMPAQVQEITVVQPDGKNTVLLAPPPRVSAVRPLVRSRGS